jgi:iron complex outermembrane receptor protein
MRQNRTWTGLGIRTGVALAASCVAAGGSLADPALDPVVVTAPRMVDPLQVVTDPQKPQQPIPAHDGADYLKNIPGFSVIRKGGTDGDPVLRGMAGSRLNILLDGQQIFGGCGNRMDPPTAYVFPESYDKVTVFKGPQSVLNGAGSSAGGVLFERDAMATHARDIHQAGQSGTFLRGQGSLTLGSFGRNDQVGSVRTGNSDMYFQFTGTRSDSDDYKTGDGTRIHSSYTRWSSHAALGWTPNRDTLLELSGIHSEGEAAYADRTMDGTVFDRDNVSIRLVRGNISPLVRKASANFYYNYVDHVMDNYSLRTPGAIFSVSNPDRTTTGGKFDVTLAPDNLTELTVGVDFRQDTHTIRKKSGASAAIAGGYSGLSRDEDMSFDQLGLFGELNRFITEDSRIIAGFRVDQHEATDQRPTFGTAMPAPANVTQGATDERTLPSGFARYEVDLLQDRMKLFAGFGHTERFPDYWERVNADEQTKQSVFMTIDPEKTNQFDAGMIWNSGRWSGSVSAFYGMIDDYLLINSSAAPTLTRNVDATVYGGEADLGYAFTEQWKLNLAVAYVQGDNDTDNKPLAQQPPLEGKIGLEYDDRVYSFGTLWRLVSSQDRVDIGSGNIAGRDIGPTAGFGVLSFHGGWKTNKNLLLTAGVDNVLDHHYAEHLSRGSAMVPGYLTPVGVRISEPGRMLWTKLSVEY